MRVWLHVQEHVWAHGVQGRAHERLRVELRVCTCARRVVPAGVPMRVCKGGGGDASLCVLDSALWVRVSLRVLRCQGVWAHVCELVGACAGGQPCACVRRLPRQLELIIVVVTVSPLIPPNPFTSCLQWITN